MFFSGGFRPQSELLVLMDRFEHHQIQTCYQNCSSSDPKITCWRNFYMIRHDFAWRNLKKHIVLYKNILSNEFAFFFAFPRDIAVILLPLRPRVLPWPSTWLEFVVIEITPNSGTNQPQTTQNQAQRKQHKKTEPQEPHKQVQCQQKLRTIYNSRWTCLVKVVVVQAAVLCSL